MSDIETARRAIDDAIDALSIEMWRGRDLDKMERVHSPEACIAIELDRVDRAIGPAGQSMFAALSQQVTHAMIALFEARNALTARREPRT